MFLTEFVLDTAQLTFLPDEEEFQDKIAEVIKQFQVIDLLLLFYYRHRRTPRAFIYLVIQYFPDVQESNLLHVHHHGYMY